jgi:hypothetical protein
MAGFLGQKMDAADGGFLGKLSQVAGGVGDVMGMATGGMDMFNQIQDIPLNNQVREYMSNWMSSRGGGGRSLGDSGMSPNGRY